MPRSVLLPFYQAQGPGVLINDLRSAGVNYAYTAERLKLPLRYPSIMDAVVGNCPENAARHLINPFCPVLQSRVCESWQENNSDHCEEIPLEQRLSVILR